MNNKTPRAYQGFTLVEFMVASVLGLVVIAAVGGLYSYNRKLGDIANKRSQVQQELRTAAEMFTRDARMAGSFGCVSLGRKTAPDVPGTVDFTVHTTAPQPNSGFAHLKPIGTGSAGASVDSFGVRIWAKSSISAAHIPVLDTGDKFTADSDAIAFYYGLGDVVPETGVATGANFNKPAHGNYAVQQAFDNKEYLVATDCNKLELLLPAAKGATTISSTHIPDGTLTSLNQTNLMKYVAVAYMVGFVGPDKATAKTNGTYGLYRMELGEEGKWTAPQMLAKSVTGIETIRFAHIPDCPDPSINAEGPANQYTVLMGGDATYRPGGTAKEVPPSAVTMVLKYDYDTLTHSGARDIATGGKNNEFYITANIRTGGYCANRRLEPTP